MHVQKLWMVVIAGSILFLSGACGSNEEVDKLFESSGGSTVDASTGGSGNAGTSGSGGEPDASPGGGSGGFSGSSGNGGVAGASASSGTGGTAGQPPPPIGDIPCPQDDPSAPQACTIPTEVCCVSFNDVNHGDCVTAPVGSSCDTAITCAGPADCPPGDQCCGRLRDYGPTNRYERVTCRPSCNGFDEVTFCDPFDEYQTCSFGSSCERSSILPNGYWVCR